MIAILTVTLARCQGTTTTGNQQHMGPQVNISHKEERRSLSKGVVMKESDAER